MIKKLRRKFVAVIMGVVTLLIVSAFVAILLSTYNDLRQNSLNIVRRAAAQTISPNTPHIAVPAVGVPTLTAAVDSTGNISILNNQLQGINAGEVFMLCKEAIASGRTSGDLKGNSLAYYIQPAQKGLTVVAFKDTTIERLIIRNLLINTALIATPTLLICFVISLLLSRWVVKPVEKAWDSQRQFVADASHELKTPLTVILSNSAMLADEGANAGEKTRTRLDNITAEAKRMKTLVDDLLSLARSDEARNKCRHEMVNLSSVLLSAALIYEPVIFDMGKAFDYDIADDLCVDGDAGKLRELAEILLDNACKHSTPSGRITLNAKATARGEICLEVTNASETIPKAELGKIFERFYRLDKARSGGGYGLGLSIASSIVREHRGRIWASSENGQTVFSVQLPGSR